MKFSRWEPTKVHWVGDIPFVYNRNDKKISQYEAERRFKASVNTMQTWATRAFRLAAAQPDPELRSYSLERFGWVVSDIESWIKVIRGALEEADSAQRKQEKIDKLLALAESTTFPEEADTARRMARKQK